MEHFCSLFRNKDQFQMVELAENLQLSNLWLSSTADSWYPWMILILFFLGLKLYSVSSICSLESKTSVTTDTSAGLKFGWKTNQGLQNKTLNAPFSVYSTKTYPPPSGLKRYKNTSNKYGFSRVVNITHIWIIYFKKAKKYKQYHTDKNVQTHPERNVTMAHLHCNS